jgi:hypothetical protein
MMVTRISWLGMSQEGDSFKEGTVFHIRKKNPRRNERI